MMKTKQQKNNSVTVVNKDQIQSYIMTTAKYDFSVYEKRILYRIVEMAQGELQGVRFATDCKKIEHTLFDTVHITMPIASLLNGESDENYTRVKQALLSLQKKIFTYEDEKEWISISIIALPKIKKRSSVVSFQIDSHIWDCCLDFSKGFRKYELATAMKFKSVYSMRFYELLSGQKTKLIYPLEQLKEMFKVQDKYAKTNDFVRKVIEPAKNELDELSPYTFEWSANKEGKKIVSFNFYPIFKPEHRDAELYKKELQKQTGLSWDLGRQVISYLKTSLEFSDKEIKNNRDLFVTAQMELPDIMTELAILRGKSRTKTNPKGWIINALKGKIKDKFPKRLQALCSDLDRQGGEPHEHHGRVQAPVRDDHSVVQPQDPRRQGGRAAAASRAQQRRERQYARDHEVRQKCENRVCGRALRQCPRQQRLCRAAL